MKNRLFLLSLLLAGVTIVMAVVIIISVTATAARTIHPRTMDHQHNSDSDAIR